MKENFIRIGCFLLGVLLTVSAVLVKDKFVGQEIVEEYTTEVAEITTEEETTTEVSMMEVLEAEAEEKIKEIQEEAEAKKAEEAQEESSEEDIVYPNDDIRSAKLKWIADYPQITETSTLEEKMSQRSSYEETLAVNAFDKKIIENSNIDFSDIKITIVGDSLTAATNLEEADAAKYAYPVILEQILGCKEIVNLGIGGSTISRCSDSYAMVNRWDEIPEDSDIIIIFGSSNDALFENKWQYGELEYDKRMTSGTFCGDLDELCGKIQYVYNQHSEYEHYTKFFFVAPPSTILNDGVYATDPGNMVHQRDFIAAINEIAPAYGFDVIDMYNANILNSHDIDVNQKFMPDGIHGNVDGYRIMAEHIASEIIQRIKQ